MNDLQEMYLEKASYTLDDTIKEFLLCNENTADGVIGRMLKTDKEAHDELIYYGKQMYDDAVNGINQRYKADGKYNDKYIFHFLGFDKCVCIDLVWTKDKNYFLLQILDNPGDFVCIEPSTYDTYILSDNPDRYKDALKDLDETEEDYDDDDTDDGDDGAAVQEPTQEKQGGNKMARPKKNQEPASAVKSDKGNGYKPTLQDYYSVFTGIYKQASAIPRDEKVTLDEDEYNEILNSNFYMTAMCFLKDTSDKEGYYNAYEEHLFERKDIDKYIIDIRTLDTDTKYPYKDYDFVVIDTMITNQYRNLLFLLQGRYDFALFDATYNHMISVVPIKNVREMLDTSEIEE